MAKALGASAFQALSSELLLPFITLSPSNRAVTVASHLSCAQHSVSSVLVQAAETANAELALRLAQQQEIDAEKTTQLAADQQMIEARRKSSLKPKP